MHLISINDLKAEEIENIAMNRPMDIEYKKAPQVGLYFLEQSTRTKHSFISAANLLNWKWVDFLDKNLRDESTVDKLTMMLMYVDILIIRSDKPNIVEMAKVIANKQFRGKVVINAGNGDREHPTQALVDYATMRRYSERDAVRPKFFYKPPHRAVSSLHYLLEKVNGYNKNDIIPTEKVNFIYVCKGYTGLIDKDITKKYPNAYIMHPLPRNEEISTELDSYSKSIYLEQALNGIETRAFLMQFLYRN